MFAFVPAYLKIIFWALDKPHPQCQQEMATIATDDIILISTSRDASVARLHKIDEELRTNGVDKHVDEDVDGKPFITAFWC